MLKPLSAKLSKALIYCNFLIAAQVSFAITPASIPVDEQPVVETTPTSEGEINAAEDAEARANGIYLGTDEDLSDQHRAQVGQASMAAGLTATAIVTCVEVYSACRAAIRVVVGGCAWWDIMCRVADRHTCCLEMNACLGVPSGAMSDLSCTSFSMAPGWQ